MAFNIDIVGGFFVVTDFPVTNELIRNPRSETTFTFDDVSDIFQFFYKEPNQNGTANLGILGSSNVSYDFADLNAITEDGVAVAKSTASALSIYLSSKIGFFFNPNPIDVVLSGESVLLKSAFNELVVSNNVPVIQNTAEYGLIPSNFREYTSFTGTTGIEAQMFKVTTGTTVYGYGAIQSFRSINNSAGQGALERFSGLFESNVANSWSGIGLLSISDELSFGYNGVDFGIWYRKGGVPEVQTITVTAPASGATNLTLTLNSVAYVIPLTAGTTAFNAYEIEAWLNANQSVWVADQIDNTVIISAQSDGAKAGTYTYSHATSTGSIAQNKAGITKTSTHIVQADWSNDIMSSLDPTKINNYAINYGNGNFKFFIETAEGVYIKVHTIDFLNANTTVELTNQSLRVGMYVASVGSTIDIAVKCSRFSAFIQGESEKTRNPRSVKHTQTVTTSFTNILSLRNRRTYNYFYNQVDVSPVNISFSSESTKNVEIEIRTNSSFGAATNYTNVGNNLVTDIDTTANTTSGGRLLSSFTLSGGDSKDIDLTPFKIVLPPSLALTITARVTSGSSSVVTSTLTYYEDL
jgi:hypothetical protein